MASVKELIDLQNLAFFAFGRLCLCLSLRPFFLRKEGIKGVRSIRKKELLSLLRLINSKYIQEYVKNRMTLLVEGQLEKLKVGSLSAFTNANSDAFQTAFALASVARLIDLSTGCFSFRRGDLEKPSKLAF